MRNYLALLIIFFSGFIQIKAQDPVFSQYFLNSMDMNPANAGSANDPRIFLHYRNQLPALGSTFTTYQGSFDQYYNKIHSGFGLNILEDNVAGSVLTSTNIDLIYSYRIKLDKNFTLQAGIQASLQLHGSDFSQYTTGLPYSEPLRSSQIFQPDFGAGFLGMSRNSNVGFSVYHLNTGFLKFNNDFATTPLKFMFYYSREFKVASEKLVNNDDLFVTPAILIQNQGPSSALDFGTSVTKGNLSAGIWMRNNLPIQLSGIIFSAGISFGNMQFVYSYDYQTSSILNYMPFTGAHEISFTTTFPLDSKHGRFSPIKCPDINQNVK